MRVAAASDVGLVRKRNEDYFVVSEERELVVLCDGMGGHPGGDIASRMVAEQVRDAVEARSRVDGVQLDLQEHDELQAFEALLRGIFLADRKLRQYGETHPEYQGLGTTLVALQMCEGSICATHVGDSRIYRFRSGSLEQITSDHSLVATNPEYAHLAGMKNILTRAMGVGDDLAVDFRVDPAVDNDIYLLCTDGLTNFVPEQRIQEVLASTKSGEQMVAQLVEDAKQGGGGDNITLAIAALADRVSSASATVRGTVKQTNRQWTVQLESDV